MYCYSSDLVCALLLIWPSLRPFIFHPHSQSAVFLQDIAGTCYIPMHTTTIVKNTKSYRLYIMSTCRYKGSSIKCECTLLEELSTLHRQIYCSSSIRATWGKGVYIYSQGKVYEHIKTLTESSVAKETTFVSLVKNRANLAISYACVS